MSFQLEITPAEGFSKLSAAEYVEKTLRKQIISGEIPLGARLVERDLAKKFDVSTTPVRHAIMTLADEGLIEIFPYKGYNVIQLTKEYVRNIIDARSIVELHAARDAYSNLMKENRNLLMDILDKADSVIKDPEDTYTATIVDTHFHSTIVSHSNNSVLLDMWRVVGSRTMLMQCYSKRYYGFTVEKFRNNHIGIASAVSEDKGVDVFIKEIKNDLIGSFDLHSSMIDYINPENQDQKIS